MAAPEMANVYLVIANAILDSVATIAVKVIIVAVATKRNFFFVLQNKIKCIDFWFCFTSQVSARYCVLNAASTLTASANAIPDGRAKNARCVTMNARWPTAMDTDIVLVANANAYAVSRGNSAKKVGVCWSLKTGE